MVKEVGIAKTGDYPAVKSGNGESAAELNNFGRIGGNKELIIERYFSAPFEDVYRDPKNIIKYALRTVEIKDDAKNILETVEGTVFPEDWGQNPANTVATKYFRRTDVPGKGRELDIRELAGRVGKKISQWGVEQGYFDIENGKALEQELVTTTIGQYAAFNSPVWFNLGLDLYGIKQDGENFYMEDGRVKQVHNYYANPQVSACFIVSPEDSIKSMINVSANISSEIFRGGSGIGGDWSKIRSAGEPVSGGGFASGARRFQDVQDATARVVKSGGKTRRAATMQSLAVWHPDMIDMIRDKYSEDLKGKILVEAGSPDDWESHTFQNLRGQNVNYSVRTDDAFWLAYEKDELYDIRFVKSCEVKERKKARDIAKIMAFTTHGCGDPGIQNDTIINKWNTCPNSGRINASNPCVTGDTKVLLKDGRWLRIDSLINKNSVILTNTGLITESEIKGSFKTGIKPVYRLTTKSGYEIKLTADHGVFTVNRGFVKACELTKDDFILIPNCNVAQINEIEDKEFYQILGIYLGDGGSGKISNNRGIPLTMNRQSEVTILQKLAEYVATKYERITHKNCPATVQITKTSAKYVITNNILLNRISEMIDLSLCSSEKRISEKIFSLSLSEQKFVLQGLFTSDGTVANYGTKSQYVSLDSTSINLLKEVQILLTGFGIKSKIYKNRRAGKSSALLPDGKGGLKEYPVKEMHSLRISKNNRIKFEKLIGFMPESQKSKKLKILNENVEAYKELPIDAVDSLIYLGDEEVFDLTEPITHTFIANGITIHNCSEYMFLDDSACNLASINLLRFRKENGQLDVQSLEKIVDLYVTSQDVMISKASYPTEKITLNSHKFRPIGLGYANLGAFIMANGWAYDSDEARDFAGAVTSLLTAEAALQSTKLAENVGAFEEFEKNKEPMLNVMEMHRKASKQLRKENGLEEIVDAANKKWDEVIERGNKYGFRNAQFTLLAPTGTIGFMMGCDTTGCEPEYQLVKYKELAGGGFMMITNETVPVALKTLGYSQDRIEKIVSYVNEDMPDGKKRGTVEGCPDLKPEHLPVFDCSISSPYGKRFISPRAHVEMLGAIQPHLSGAISKTINCPNNTTVEEIEELMYLGWKRGVKALALYRDGSKAAQPLKKRSASKLVNLARGEREPLPKERKGMIRKVKVGGINLFLTTGEYEDGRLGELFIESLERGSEVNRLLNEVAIEFSEKIQYGVPLEQALEIFQKAGNSQIAGITDHEFIKMAKGPEGFLYDFLRAHYLGDISCVHKEKDSPEMRPLPWELKIFKKVPQLHLIPSVAGIGMYPGVPTLEETIKKVSKTNYWEDADEGLDTRQTIDKIKRTRAWGKENNNEFYGRITGKMCDKGHLMISDGGCFKCPICKTSTGGCGGG